MEPKVGSFECKDNKSEIMDILVFRFYGYIGDISTDILEKNINRRKIDQNL